MTQPHFFYNCCQNSKTGNSLMPTRRCIHNSPLVISFKQCWNYLHTTQLELELSSSYKKSLFSDIVFHFSKINPFIQFYEKFFFSLFCWCHSYNLKQGYHAVTFCSPFPTTKLKWQHSNVSTCRTFNMVPHNLTKFHFPLCSCDFLLFFTTVAETDLCICEKWDGFMLRSATCYKLLPFPPFFSFFTKKFKSVCNWETEELLGKEACLCSAAIIFQSCCPLRL